jgi:hypothetical protein
VIAIRLSCLPTVLEEMSSVSISFFLDSVACLILACLIGSAFDLQWMENVCEYIFCEK